MNVRCPSCETLYRVDPAKVPEQGIQASCAECPAVITVVQMSDDRAVDVSPEITSSLDVGADTFVPPPLVSVDEAIDSIAEPSPQLEVPAYADDDLTAVNYGADIFDEPATIEVPPPFEQSEIVVDELPPLSEAPVVEEELTLPDVNEPTEIEEPIPAFEPAFAEPQFVDEIPPIPEAPIPVDEEQVPVVAEEQVLAVDEEQVPAVDEEQVLAVDEEQVPAVDEEQVLAVDEEQVPAVDELPPVPDLSAADDSTDIEIPAPESEPAVPPVLEVMPSEEPSPPVQPRRYTRPFLRRPEESPPSPPPAPSGPMRPTAPVFRPTPGMPVQPPPAPEPMPPVDVAPVEPMPPVDVVPEPPAPEPMPPVDVVPAPPAPEPESDTQPEVSPVTPEPKPRKPVNPFLSKDPKQKARRLARALVSDMIVYQPQKRQDALAAGTLKEDFDEEIKKSWEEYVDQIGNELATQTEFFKEALNEILAGGNEIF